jgi:hypothetical protein
MDGYFAMFEICVPARANTSSKSPGGELEPELSHEKTQLYVRWGGVVIQFDHIRMMTVIAKGVIARIDTRVAASQQTRCMTATSL